MSGMDRLTVTDAMIDAALEHYAEGGCMGLGGDEKREVVASILEAGLRELLSHRRASQAAPAPSDGLREAVDAAWNDAIEAAANCAGVHFTADHAAMSIRALRRAAPTEGVA